MKNQKLKRCLTCLLCGLLSSCSSIYSVKKFNKKSAKSNSKHTQGIKVHEPLITISKTEGFLNFLPSSGNANFQYTVNGRVIQSADLLDLPLPLLLVCYLDVLEQAIRLDCIIRIKEGICREDMRGLNQSQIKDVACRNINRNFETFNQILVELDKNKKYLKYFAEVCNFKVPSCDYFNDSLMASYENFKKYINRHYYAFLKEKPKFLPLANKTLNKTLSFKQKVFEILEEYQIEAAPLRALRAARNDNNNNNNNNAGQCKDQFKKK